jgi:site-specific recombinase XerD
MVLAKRREQSKVEFMTPQKTKTTTESIALFKQTLEGNNYSPQSIKAYAADLRQFVEWLKTRRVDWDIPYRIARIDLLYLSA